ncbi:MAG: tyrosine-type recombinase/integrase [Microlunatus sp.]|nr:tyrosine-type recombinase/integrase [Microlunatus sp.]
MSVYAGIDPVTKRRHYLKQTIPAATPKIEDAADKVLRRLQVQVDERRQPRTNTTVKELVTRHLELVRLEETNARGYRGKLDNHIAPLIGHVKVGAIDADVLDSFYAELQRCRVHCDGRPFIEHRTEAPHDCDLRCRPHECQPLSASSVRQIHFILSGAFKRAVRWNWVATNPIKTGEPPAAPRPNPKPPTAGEAVRIVEEAFKEPAWGALVWLAMTSGARRGELCALRWSRVDLDTGTVVIDSSIAQLAGKTWLKSTKTHQQRRITLESATVEILRELRAEAEARAAAIGANLTPDAYVFSLVPDSSTYRLPDSVSQRYSKTAARLGIKTHLHQLRHYSATELIAAGVDIRTVAGRLGHSGGGTTTLRVYTAFVSEADQRASEALKRRMPTRPQQQTAAERSLDNPRAPYEIANAIRQGIASGKYRPGTQLPGTRQLVLEYNASANTIRRAVNLLTDCGAVNESRTTQII